MKDKKPIHSLLLLDGEPWRVRQISFLQSLSLGAVKLGRKLLSLCLNTLRAKMYLSDIFPNHRLTESKIRISIGTKDQMITLIQTIKNWLNENS